MQSTAHGTVPEAVTGDPSDVAVALEVAGALWEKGNKEEALRWLKRAVEAASEAGDGTRAAALAEAAGSIEGSLPKPSEAAPPPPSVVSAPPPPAPSLRPPYAAVSPSPPPPPPTASSAPVGTVPPKTVPPTRDQRIRVSVKTSVRDPELILLRPLREGQRAPTGTREGFLVLPDVETSDRSHANGGGSP